MKITKQLIMLMSRISEFSYSEMLEFAENSDSIEIPTIEEYFNFCNCQIQIKDKYFKAQNDIPEQDA